MKKLSFIFCFVLGLAACSNSSIKTTKPYTGNIQQSFTELAETKLEHVYDINMPLSGELKRITLEPGDTVKKEQVIAELILFPLQHEVDAAAANVHQIELLLEQQGKERKRFEKLYRQKFVSNADIDKERFKGKVLQKRLDQNKATLAIATYNLKQATISSPINGVILKRLTQGQKWLPEGTPLLQIGNLDELEAVAEVLTHQAQQLKEGDPVILTNLDNRIIIEGQVKRIDPSGFTKKSSLGVDEQRVYVTINLGSHKEVRLGTAFQLQAKFLIGQQDKEVIIVPRFTVLQDKDGRYYVFKVLNKKLHKQTIAIGIITDQEISVTEGLTLQDTIVSQPTSEMVDGMKI